MGPSPRKHFDPGWLVSIKIHPKDFPAEIAARFRETPKTIIRGMNDGAAFGQALLAHRTPRATGETAALWEVKPGNPATGEGPVTHNDAPHVGVLETGARPHAVSPEGIEALARWAKLKFGLSPKDALDAANAIAWRIRKKGVKPTYFVRDSRRELASAMARGIIWSLIEASTRRAGR